MKNRHIAFWLIATMISSSVMAQNTLDTASKNSGQETTAKTDTLPDIMKEYMILKLKPEGMGYKLDTVSKEALPKPPCISAAASVTMSP